MSDTDIWWHLRTGQLILARGEVPQVDWFTFIDFDKPWIDLHWGFQLLATALHSTGGVNLLILAKSALFTLTIWIGWSATGRSLPAGLKSMLWLIPILLITGRSMERPEMLSLVFLAALFWIFGRLEERPSLIWLVPLVHLIWVNCHALFVLGLVLCACYGADLAIHFAARGRWGLEKPNQRLSPRLCVGCAALSLGACFINPYFEQGVLFPLVLYRKFTIEQSFYSARIGEFQTPLQIFYEHGWLNAFILPLILQASGTLASFIWLAVARRRWNCFRLLVFVAFSHLAWKASRNASLFAIAAGVITCANVADALPAAVWERCTWLRTCLARGFVLIAGCLSLAVVTGGWGAVMGEGGSFGLGERPGWYPHAACQFAGQPGFPTRAFVAHQGHASVYIYQNAPGRRVFMDARLEVCTQHTFQMYEEILDGMARGDDRQWEDVLRNGGGELPAIVLDSRFSRRQINALLQSPGWRLVFAEPAGAVFLEWRQAENLGLQRADAAPLVRPPGS